MVGLWLGYGWFMVGLCLAYVGLWLVYVWFMFGLCLVHVWFMFGLCLVHVWFMFGSCLVYVWFMFGLCLVLSRVETISYMESVLLGDPFLFLSHWPRVSCLARLPSLALCNQVPYQRYKY